MNPWISVPVTLALVYRARTRNSLTTGGIVAAVLTAITHAIHPWSVFFTLLIVFFLIGTAVTKVKHDVKAHLTSSAAGAGGEGPRGYIQVFANSLIASVLILFHALKISFSDEKSYCFPRRVEADDILVFGIIGNYVAVAADTFSSELGILSNSSPRLIVAPWRVVPRGTNGGVTMIGLLAGTLGSLIISAVSVTLLPFCSSKAPPNKLFPGSTSSAGWELKEKLTIMLAMTAVGLAGSVLDSVYGALFQASVIERKSGKVIEGEGGRKVILPKSSAAKEKAESGWQIAVGRDILSNNGVNLLMAASMSFLAMYGACWVFDIPLGQVLE